MSDDQFFSLLETKLAYNVTTAHLAGEFREHAQTLQAIGASIDIVIRPYQDESLPHFSALNFKEQQAAVANLAQYVSICQDVVASGGSLRSSSTFTWRALRALKLVPSSSLFNVIGEDDVVEVYNLQNIQIFRNFKFFEFCSYTLEDLYSRPWHELFVREDHQLTEKLLNFLTGLIGMKNRGTATPDVGEQFTREVNSAERYRIALEIKNIAVLFDSDDMAEAFIAIESARIAR